MNSRQLYERAVDTWGKEAQCNQAIEELAELIVAIRHMVRQRSSGMDEMIEEIADVEIMVGQLRHMISQDQHIEDAKNQKLAFLAAELGVEYKEPRYDGPLEIQKEIGYVLNGTEAAFFAVTLQDDPKLGIVPTYTIIGEGTEETRARLSEALNRLAGFVRNGICAEYLTCYDRYVAGDGICASCKE